MRASRVALVMTLLAAAASPCIGEPASGDPAAVFAHFQGLAGKWEGHSTKGWDNEMSARVIARDSVVVFSSFDSHPGEAMLTTLVIDGEDLILTHYCVARNQPRLVATAISEDGRTVTFTFRDGTNLPSRDVGHMDQVVYRFLDEDRFTSRWTWYQDGAEKWMEEIQYHRLP